MPWTVPAMTAIRAAPIAQREIVVVIRSQRSSVHVALRGLEDARHGGLDLRHVDEHEERDEDEREDPEGEAEHVAGDPDELREARTGPCRRGSPRRLWTCSAAPVSPTGSSSSDSRRSPTISGKSLSRSRMLSRSGTARRSASSVTATTVPRTRIVAASPRPRRVFSMSSRSGNSKTNARKTPMNTRRSASEIENSAQTPSSTATTTSSARTGIVIWTGRWPPAAAPVEAGSLTAPP